MSRYESLNKSRNLSLEKSAGLKGASCLLLASLHDAIPLARANVSHGAVSKLPLQELTTDRDSVRMTHAFKIRSPGHVHTQMPKAQSPICPRC